MQCNKQHFMFLESGVEKRLLGEAGYFCQQNSNRNCKQNHWKMLSNEQTVAEFLKKFQRIPKPSKFSSLKKSWSRRLRLLTPLKLDCFFSFYFFLFASSFFISSYTVQCVTFLIFLVGARLCTSKGKIQWCIKLLSAHHQGPTSSVYKVCCKS